MEYRRCGNSGIKLPALSLGLWHNFGRQDDQEKCRSILHTAFDCGITHFDLANNYGPPPGAAEETFGKILKQDFLPYRDELIISSKAGYYMWPGPYGEWGSRKYIIASCDQSLKRMGLDYFDIFYHHRPCPDIPLEETHGALETLIQQGKVLYAGVSSYPVDMTDATIRLREKKKWFPMTIHQPVYSMLNRWIEDGLIKNAAKHGYGIIAFSPLAQGLLSDRYLKGVPAESRFGAQGRENVLSESQLVKIRSLNVIAAERGQSLAQMALAWVLRHPEVTSVLTAVSSVDQLRDSLQILNKLAFAPDELERIEQVLAVE